MEKEEQGQEQPKMRFTASLPMTTERGLAGNLPRHHWDQSFLEVDQFPSVDSPPATNNSRRKSEDVGNWNGTLDLVSFDQCAIPQSPSSMAPGRTVDYRGKAFRMESGLLSDFRIPGLRFCRSPEDHQQHIYQNGGIQLDDAPGADDVLVDSVSRLSINSACFFFPVAHPPRTPTVAAPRSSLPWLTITPSGSETDTESRSQSISSQDSSDQDNVGGLSRIRDDSGIGMTWCGEVLPRRNSSAPTLNELNVVGCGPSPSPIIEFPQEPLTMPPQHPTATGVDSTIEDSSKASSLITVEGPGHDAYMRVAR